LGDTFLPSFPDFPSFALTGEILVTRMRSRLSAATAASIVSAMRSPLTISPPRVRPAYAKVAICFAPAPPLTGPATAGHYVLPDPLVSGPESLAFRPDCRPPWHRSPIQPRAGHDTHAAVDHFLQFVAIR